MTMVASAKDKTAQLFGLDITDPPPYKVKDMALSEWGRKEIEIAEKEMPGLMVTRAKYGPEKPLQGLRVMGSLHMTIQTAVLIETSTPPRTMQPPPSPKQAFRSLPGRVKPWTSTGGARCRPSPLTAARVPT